MTASKRKRRQCEVKGCPRPCYRNHLCATHDRRRRAGDPEWARLDGVLRPCSVPTCKLSTKTPGPCHHCASLLEAWGTIDPAEIERIAIERGRSVSQFTCRMCGRVGSPVRGVWSNGAKGPVCGPCLRGEPTPQALEQARRLDVEHRRIRSAQEKRDAELAEQAFAPARRPTPAWQEAAIARSGVNASWHSISGHTDIGRGRNTNTYRKNGS